MSEDRFVFVPLRIRREHRDWSNAEHAAWIDLYLASLEVEGRFDSLDVARAYLGPRAAALDALIARGAFAEFDGTWSLTDYLELYDGRRPRHYKTLAQRLADADAREARGEPLLPIERWARWKARQNAKRSESDTETEGDRDKEVDRANVGPTFANEPPPSEPLNPCPRCGSVVRLFEGKGGPFYGCSEFSNSGCSWKSNDSPKPRSPLIDLNSPENIKLRGVAS